MSDNPKEKTMTTEIKVLLGDITKITDVDAIVNAANEDVYTVVDADAVGDDGPKGKSDALENK